MLQLIGAVKAMFKGTSKLNDKTIKLHLGCGTNYLKGWVNLDLDSPLADANIDLRKPLSFENASVDFIFNEHFIEHITYYEGLLLLKECRRILKPNGVLRISTPSLQFLVQQYLANRITEWKDVDWLPASPCKLLNEGMREWGHQFVYDYDQLLESLTLAGFSQITRPDYRESLFHDLRGLECRPWHHELIVEAK